MKYGLFILLSFLLFGCRDYENAAYFTKEEEAIEELLTEFIQIDTKLAINHYERAFVTSWSAINTWHNSGPNTLLFVDVTGRLTKILDIC